MAQDECHDYFGMDDELIREDHVFTDEESGVYCPSLNNYYPYVSGEYKSLWLYYAME